MNKVVVGIDPSSAKLAIVVGTVKGLVMSVRTVKLPSSRPAACVAAYDSGVLLSRHLGVVNIALEAPVMGRGGPGSTIPQAMISGALQAGIGAVTAQPIVMANNAQWKKTVCGHGNLNKDGITKWLLENYPDWEQYVMVKSARGVTKVDQDIADALCIYLYGIRHWRATRKVKSRLELR